MSSWFHFGSHYLRNLQKFLAGAEKELKMNSMAASLTTAYPVPAPEAGVTTQVRSNRPRRISPEAGRALEILGHAIEYLTDELVHEGGPFTANSGPVEAVQLLMALNRSIYFECPVIPTMRERMTAYLKRRFS